MDQTRPKPPRFRLRISTFLSVVVIAVVLMQVYIEWNRLRLSMVHARVARDEAEMHRAYAEKALQRALAQVKALQNKQSASPPPPQPKSAAASK